MTVDRERFERMLNPRSIAVVGDRAPNYGWPTCQSEFPGPVYSVQVDPTEAAAIEELRFTTFQSLAESPAALTSSSAQSRAGSRR